MKISCGILKNPAVDGGLRLMNRLLTNKVIPGASASSPMGVSEW
jgi:hypothetical protein